MHALAEYLQSLVAWVALHPTWALCITFLISFSESVAILGTLIPGSVTMTAIGILAGTGIMRIDLTIFMAILGAIAGDGLSYILGYVFSTRLPNLWPFSRYPGWIHYGKEYFERHGGKSIIIGRFAGPLRSIIPMIAGMMHMNQWQFLVSNIISAIGWSVLYLVPGILVGTASSELSPEIASRFFFVILILFIVLWLAAFIITKGIKILNNLWLTINFHRLWIYLSQMPFLGKIFKYLTPTHEKNHHVSALLLFFFCLAMLLSCAAIISAVQSSGLVSLNNPLYYFLQSVRTKTFDVLCIVLNFFITPVSVLGFFIAVTVLMIYERSWRALRYWLSLGFSCGLIVSLLAALIQMPRPSNILHSWNSVFFPAIGLTFATAWFEFFMLYMSTRIHTIASSIIRLCLFFILLLTGMGTIYLGDNWFSNIWGAYCIGTTIGLLHWIFYRRRGKVLATTSQIPLFLCCVSLLFSAIISYGFWFKSEFQTHQLYLKQYVLTDEAWWHQRQPILPIYTMNRIGKPVGLFNIQYAGSLKTFVKALESYGWKKQPSSFFYSLITQKWNKPTTHHLSPFIDLLYFNKKPILIMTYELGEARPPIILYLWHSNYHLLNYYQPIWLGSVHQQISHANLVEESTQTKLFDKILPALYGFKTNMVILREQIQSLPQSNPATLLFIKEQAPLPPEHFPHNTPDT